MEQRYGDPQCKKVHIFFACGGLKNKFPAFGGKGKIFFEPRLRKTSERHLKAIQMLTNALQRLGKVIQTVGKVIQRAGRALWRPRKAIHRLEKR